MKTIVKKYFYLLLLLISIGVQGQSKKIAKANEKFNRLGYINAVEIYKEVADKGFVSEELLRRLSNGLFFNAKYEEAVTWYSKLYKITSGKIKTKELLRYSQCLNAIGNEEEAQKMYTKFLKASAITNNDYISVEDYLNIIEENSERYFIKKLSINSDKYTDFGSYFANNKLYFASARNYRKSIGKIDTWTNQPFLDIYYSEFIPQDSTYSTPKLLKGDVNTSMHESTPVISRDGKTMYFTRINTTKVYKDDSDVITRLKIYRATKNAKGKWTNITDLTINGEMYSTAHPVLNYKENRLYFVSNRPGGFGETDIYYANISDNGDLGKPINLGNKVNTSGRDSFPFLSQEEELYFSSDGHFGLGGYDVFYIDLLALDQQLLNVGRPINSDKDDYAYFINSKSKKGYLSSNRDVKDNIYAFTEFKPIQDLLTTSLEGVVIDKKTNLPISNAVVTLRNVKNEIKVSLVTSLEGKFTTKINRYMPYIVRAEKENYNPEDVFVAKKQTDPKVKLALDLNQEKLQEGLDIAKLLNVVIYFDFDRSEIRSDAKVELEKVVAVLKKYKNIKLSLKAHTDSKGKDAYNLKLSQRRADASMAYLIEAGISKDRLTAKGYGETQLTNKCKNNIKCSKAEHQQNRRTEFIVKK